MPITHERIIHVLASSAIVGALSLQSQPARAKVDVPYGSDGSPPDPDTQAKVDAFNDALDGPDDGESTEHWQTRLEDAHEALYGTGIDFDGSTTNATGSGGSGGATGGGVTHAFDLCESPVSDWLGFDETQPPPISSELVADALDDPSVRGDIKTELANFSLHMMRIQTAGTVASVGRPSVSELACTLGNSAVTIRIPVTLVELGVSLDSGTLTVHASASYRVHPHLDDWCLDVQSYDVTGFAPILRQMIMPRIGEAMSEDPFCMPAFGPAYAVTYSGG